MRRARELVDAAWHMRGFDHRASILTYLSNDVLNRMGSLHRGACDTE
jgi:hypothetical protein